MNPFPDWKTYEQRELFENMLIWDGEWRDLIPFRQRLVKLADLHDVCGFEYRARSRVSSESLLDPELGSVLVNIIVKAGTNEVLANFEDVLYYRELGRDQIRVLEVACSDEQALGLRLHEIRRLKTDNWARRLALIFRDLAEIAYQHTQAEWAEHLDIKDKSGISKLQTRVDTDLWEQVCTDQMTPWEAYSRHHARACPEPVDQKPGADQEADKGETDRVLERLTRSSFVNRESCLRHPAGFFDYLRQAAGYLEDIERAHGVPLPVTARTKRRVKRAELIQSTTHDQ